MTEGLKKTMGRLGRLAEGKGLVTVICPGCGASFVRAVWETTRLLCPRCEGEAEVSSPRKVR